MDLKRSTLDEVVLKLPLPVRRRVEAWADSMETLMSVHNPVVMARLGPSAVRGLFLRRGRHGPVDMPAHHVAHFNFDYPQVGGPLAALYAKAKRLQWDGATDLPWQTSVDPLNPEVPLLDARFLPWELIERHSGPMDPRARAGLRAKVASWMLSQFLHGEQGALMASAQVTEATPSFEGKLYGATQVMDEARHVEVFLRYLDEKLEHRYPINDNLYTIIDGLMADGRWDMKFLGMQILVEGLALGAFATLHKMTAEPLLKELLRRVIHDEARHVRYGLLSLRDLYTQQLSEGERREREDWAFEVVLLMRDRFLAHELYDEAFAHCMSRRTWNQIMSASPGMQTFRQVMFQRLVPNLKAIGLLTPRVEAHYARVGLDRYFGYQATDALDDEALLAA